MADGGTLVVHKQVLAVSDDDQSVPGRVVHVEAGGPARPGALTVWFERDPDGRPWYYRTFGTGHPIPSDVVHAGTVLDPPFVWHLYLVRSPR